MKPARERDQRQRDGRGRPARPDRTPSARTAATAPAAEAERRGEADRAADDDHHPDLPQHHRAHPRRRRAERHAQRRSRASAATPCRRARRRARPPRAASPAARTPPTASLIIRSRKTFSRTCCGIVFRSSTGRFGSSRAITSGTWPRNRSADRRRAHVEVESTRASRPAGTGRKKSGGISSLHLAVLRVLHEPDDLDVERRRCRRRCRCTCRPRRARG